MTPGLFVFVRVRNYAHGNCLVNFSVELRLSKTIFPCRSGKEALFPLILASRYTFYVLGHDSPDGLFRLEILA